MAILSRWQAISDSVMKIPLFLSMLFMVVSCSVDSPKKRFLEMRQLPKREMKLAFDRLNDNEKIEIFFQSRRRHPPYRGMDNEIRDQGKDFLVRLRNEIDVRGGMVEVLSFMGFVLDLKRRGSLSTADMKDLRIDSICDLARSSQYCYVVQDELLADGHKSGV